MYQFAGQRKIANVGFKIEDRRCPKASASSGNVWAKMKLKKMDPAIGKKNDRKIERWTSSAVIHNDAEVRFDPPSQAVDRSLVFGPDHRVMKPPDSTLPPEGCIAAGAYDDEDNLFGDDEEDDIVETRVVCNHEINEAKRDAILGAVTTATWQRAKERLNKHEKLFLNIAEND